MLSFLGGKDNSEELRRIKDLTDENQSLQQRVSELESLLTDAETVIA